MIDERFFKKKMNVERFFRGSMWHLWTSDDQCDSRWQRHQLTRRWHQGALTRRKMPMAQWQMPKLFICLSQDSSHLAHGSSICYFTISMLRCYFFLFFKMLKSRRRVTDSTLPGASLVQVHGTSDIHDTVMTWLQSELKQLSTTISTIAIAFQRGMTWKTTLYGQD